MNLSVEIDQIVAAKSLLAHPFYQAWSAGTLSPSSLRHYAKQYFAFESRFPRFLSAIHAREERAEVRAGLLDNLWDEEHGPANHAELWLRFAESLGVSRDDVKNAEPTAATRALVETYERTSRDGDTALGLAAIYAYESQFPAVASAKFEGLRAHPKQSGTETAPSEAALAFFSVHAHVDVTHAANGRHALDSTTPTANVRALSLEAAHGACDAWSAFLDDALAAA